MRFLEHGPSIPPHLLEQQAQGNVVFFCGAGVSVPAGLDTFWQLTKRVIDNLHSEAGQAALDDRVSFDSIFQLLVRRYGRPEIDRQIHAALGQQKPKTVKHHRDILDLSRGAGGSLQLVTTNFDTLFEQTTRAVRPIVPPVLPDIEFRQSINGLVYLHGRLAEPTAQPAPSYVLSSSDFGRAYLAEGWAARFVRSLRENYTIVLLGYSADDPPMRYLLEGLNGRDGITYNSPIYVFTGQSPDEAEEAWLERGVTPICYTADKAHSALWSTIQAWAKSARDPEQWIEQSLEIARKAPADVKPHQRGQVVQLVSNKVGAKAFADADPPASSEWLCVFDPYVRYAKPAKISWEEDAEIFDPQSVYGLDDDPPRPDADEHRFIPPGAHEPFAALPDDDVRDGNARLPGWSPLWSTSLPDRLRHLARWFSNRCEEPAAIWWASGWQSLNVHMQWFLTNRLRSTQPQSIPETARHIWNLYLETRESAPLDERADDWFEFEGLLRQSGWTPAALRYFERIVTPFVEFRRPSFSVPRPPTGEWGDIHTTDVVELNVKALDRHGHSIDIPDEQLGKVTSIVRQSLVRLSELMDETGATGWHGPTLYPTEAAGEQYHGRKAQHFLWLAELFGRLVQHDLASAQHEFAAWPKDETRIFPKLRLWAAALPTLTDAARAFAVLTTLDRETFWDPYARRELLYCLKSHWPNLSASQKRAVERRIEAGPPQWHIEKRSDYRFRKATQSASMLRWLELNGCSLSGQGQRALSRLRIVEPRWTDDWARAIDESFESRGGFVEEVADAGDLSQVPLASTIDVARERTTRSFGELKQYAPFKGLVQSNSRRAFAALRRAFRNGDFAVNFWQDLLSSWPDQTPLRLRCLVAYAITKLPAPQALELRYYSTDWLQKHLAEFYAADPCRALQLFDGFLLPFLKAPIEQTGSSILTTTIGGVVQPRSEVSVNKALNSPIGRLTEALWGLTPKRARKGRRMDRHLAIRFDQLASVEGAGGGHAIATLTKRLGWIAYCYPKWMQDFLLPKFNTQSPMAEAAWHGLAYNSNALPAETWNALKASLIEVLRGKQPWSLDPHEREIFIESVIWLARPGTAIFSFDEVRDILTAIDDRERGRALWVLSKCLSKHDDWAGFVKPFIESAWPRELRYRSDEASRAFLRIAEGAGQNFPDVVETILPFIRSVQHPDLLAFRLSKETAESDAFGKHPRHALLLLDAIIADDRTQAPFSLKGALDALAALDPAVKEMAEYRRLSGLIP